MPGPFTSYAPPGAYTQTYNDPTLAALLGTIRLPVLVGVGKEEILVEDVEIVRGSSATVDNKKYNEDVSSQLDGTGNSFTVASYPVVTGSGSGVTTNNPTDLVVKVNGIQVVVSTVAGATGVVTLQNIPLATDTVTCTYYYNLTDTRITDEDVSNQADGVATTFYVSNRPIVDGSNGGRPTTTVSDIVVKINSVITVASSVSGTNGTFTLATAPGASDTVTVSYYYNNYANTADPLPYQGLTSLTGVGYAPSIYNYIEGTDFIVTSDDEIQWGAGYKLVVNQHTSGSEYLDDTQITVLLVDDMIYNEDVSSQFTGSNKSCTVLRAPIVDGTGRDVVTNDISKVTVTVDGTEVDVARVDGTLGTIYLKTAPGASAVVLVDYYRSRLEDDSYLITVDTAGATGVGKYRVVSTEDSTIGSVTDVDDTGVVNASFTGVEWLTQPKTTKGFTIDETVTLSFTDNTHFSVSSSSASGTASGSTNYGITGSTFIDDVTGLTFTLSPDAYYTTADQVVLTIEANALFTTSTTPIYDVPGVRVTVNNLTNTSAGDSTYVYTYDKAGEEPSVGSMYYVSYYYAKTDFSAQIYTKFKDIVNEYGALSVESPLSLAAYLLFLNGATAVMIKQVAKDTGAQTASSATYITAIDELRNPVEKRKPNVILPVTTDETVIAYVLQHCEVMSSMRYRSERICFFGFANGTEPQDAQAAARGYSSSRMCAIYPDGAIITLTDQFGTEQDYTVGGEYLAIALAGQNVSTAYDVAEPMTRKTIVGFKQLYRDLDEVVMDECASAGLTIIEDLDPNMRVRHAVTTNMADAYSRELNITTVKDYVQQSVRNALDKYIGLKYLANRNAEIGQTVAATMKALVESEIVVAFDDIDVATASNDPTMALVSLKYRPMVGLNWIQVTFNLRSRL